MDPVNTLVQTMGQCRILDPAQVEEVRQTLLPRYPADPRGLAGELLKRDWVTPFQINRLFAVRGPELLQGSYVLLERIGEGGMGQVFKARHWKLGRIVALKLIRKDLLTNATVVGRFRREIEATAQLDHPNLIRAFDADQTDDGLFIVMEYVEGIDFGRLIKEQGPVSAVKACDYVRQAALGLQHAHERGLVHRDIKPPNLFRANQGEVIKILDLGLARLQESAQLFNLDTSPGLTQAGVIVGTIDFMAPEQSRDSRAVDIRADLYSLGCTFVHMLTGKVPYPGGTPTEKLIKHNVDPLPPLLELPPPVRVVIHKLLAKKPQERYQTPAELASALEQVLAHPEKLQMRRSVELLPATVPILRLDREPEMLGMAPVPLARSRSEPKPRPPRPTGQQPRLRPTPTAPMATAVLEEALPQAIPVAVAIPVVQTPNPHRRFNKASRVCVFLGLLVLTAVLAWPLVFPATATQADLTRSKPVQEPVKPKPKAWDGVVREFLTVGPLPLEWRLLEQIERNPDADATYRFGLRGMTYFWTSVRTNEEGGLKVPSRFQISKPTTLFVQVHVHSKTAQNVKVLVGSSTSAAVQLNANQPPVVESDGSAKPRPDDHKGDANLNAGWNRILVRLVSRGEKDFAFYLTFEGEDLRVSLKPEKTAR